MCSRPAFGVSHWKPSSQPYVTCPCIWQGVEVDFASFTSYKAPSLLPTPPVFDTRLPCYLGNLEKKGKGKQKRTKSRPTFRLGCRHGSCASGPPFLPPLRTAQLVYYPPVRVPHLRGCRTSQEISKRPCAAPSRSSRARQRRRRRRCRQAILAVVSGG